MFVCVPSIYTHKHLSTKFLLNSPFCELSLSLLCISVHLPLILPSVWLSLFPFCITSLLPCLCPRSNQDSVQTNQDLFFPSLLCGLHTLLVSPLLLLPPFFNLIRTLRLHTTTLSSLLSPLLVRPSPPRHSPSERQQKEEFWLNCVFSQTRKLLRHLKKG